MIDRERIQDTTGAILGAGAFSLKKVSEGFDWSHFNQEVIEDLMGAIISVSVGFFLMRIYRKLWPEKK
jgi:hypothetical protein